MNKLKAVVFLAIFCILFVIIQAVLIPNWSYPSDVNQHTAKTVEYMGLEKDSVQVLFFGTSHVMYGINSMQLYDEKKIRSFDMALSGTRISPTYYYLKNALKYQKPELLMLDASVLYLDSFSSSPWKISLDSGFPYDVDRLEASVQYAKESVAYEKKTAEEQKEREWEQEEEQEELAENGMRGIFRDVNRFFNYELCGLMPMYNYHSRWSSVNLGDFMISEYSPYYGKGYVTSTVKGYASATLESVNEIANEMAADQTYAEWKLINQREFLEYRHTDLYSAEPEEEQLKWLYRIAALCKENDVELRLIKVPVISTYKEYESSWTKIRSDSVRAIANELGIKFCDMIYDVDVGLEPTDFIDSGKHLNYYGSKKTTACLGNYIEQVCGIKGAADPQYEKALPAYKRIDSAAQLQYSKDWEEYLSYLSRHLTGKTVLLAVNGVKDTSFSLEEIESLRAIGVKSQALQRLGEASYVGIIKDGKSVYESTSELPVETSYRINEDTLAVLKSYGSADTSSHLGAASIVINGTEWALNGRGINIVVHDNRTNCVVDQLNFYKKSPDSDIHCDRNTSKLDADIRNYEDLTYKLYGAHFEETKKSAA